MVLFSLPTTPVSILPAVRLHHIPNYPTTWLVTLPSTVTGVRLQQGGEILLAGEHLIPEGSTRLISGTISSLQGVKGGWAVLGVEGRVDANAERAFFLICVQCQWVSPLQHWWHRWLAPRWTAHHLPLLPTHLDVLWTLEQHPLDQPEPLTIMSRRSPVPALPLSDTDSFLAPTVSTLSTMVFGGDAIEVEDSGYGESLWEETSEAESGTIDPWILTNMSKPSLSQFRQ